MRSTIFQIESPKHPCRPPKTMAALKPIGIAYLAFCAFDEYCGAVGHLYLDLACQSFSFVVWCLSIVKEVYAFDAITKTCCPSQLLGLAETVPFVLRSMVTITRSTKEPWPIWRCCGLQQFR